MKYTLALLSVLTLLTVSCKDDFKIDDDWKDITVVYGLLDPQDTKHYIRINKAFLGEQDAYTMAGVSDSIYYKNATVYLEEYVSGNLVMSNLLVMDTTIAKDSGIFAYDRNVLYRMDGPLNVNSTYKLVIAVPGKELVTAETRLIPALTSVSWPGKVGLHPGATLKVEWNSVSFGKVYNLYLRFNFWDITATDTIANYIEWAQPVIVSSGVGGGRNMEYEVSGASFFSYLSSSFQDDPSVIKRVPRKGTFSMRFLIGTEDLYTYMQVSQPASGIVTEKPAFTNIGNGIGIFTSRVNSVSNSREALERTLDSLGASPQVDHLRFTNRAETQTYWQNYPE